MMATDRGYIVFGEGDSNLVIISGLSYTKLSLQVALLSSTFKSLRSSFRIYLFDRPPLLPNPLTNETLADWVADEAMSLGLSSFYLIGVSQGGMIAQFLALKYPGLITKLVLASTLCLCNDTAVTSIERWISYVFSQSYESLNKDFFTSLFSQKYNDLHKEEIDTCCKKLKPDDDERFVAIARACLSGTPGLAISKISCPVLVIGSKHDKVVTADASYQISEILHCPIYMYEDEGHALYDEASDFYQRCADFFLSD